MSGKIIKSIFVLLLLALCSDNIEIYYNDYNNMKAGDSYKGGWIPAVIPE